MKQDLINELKHVINNLKIEIIEKQEELNLLINQYQEFVSSTLDVESEKNN